MSLAPILTVDLGNSNGSAALVLADGGGRFAVGAMGSWSRGGGERDALLAAAAAAREALSGPGGCTRAAISAVGSVDREAAAAEALAALGMEVLVRPGAGLAMRIDHAETCGSDRQYAARGALEYPMEAAAPEAAAPEAAAPEGAAPEGAATAALQVLVVDAGTALTVDAARRCPSGGPSGGNLEFLGGAIAMGPGELRRAIVGAGARLPEFDLEGAIPALGKSTREALRSGVMVGFRGAVRELSTSIVREAFSPGEPVHVYLTGGARSAALPVLRELYGQGLTEDPLLVHRGLGAAALDTFR